MKKEQTKNKRKTQKEKRVLECQLFIGNNVLKDLYTNKKTKVFVVEALLEGLEEGLKMNKKRIRKGSDMEITCKVKTAKLK